MPKPNEKHNVFGTLDAILKAEFIWLDARGTLVQEHKTDAGRAKLHGAKFVLAKITILFVIHFT